MQRELAELRNRADSMCFELEKLIKEHDAKLGPGDKEAMTGAIEKTREAAKGADVEAVKSALSELEQASHAFSTRLYEQAAAGPQAGPVPDDPGAADQKSGEDSSGDDDAIDAEFEVKDSE